MEFFELGQSALVSLLWWSPQLDHNPEGTTDTKLVLGRNPGRHFEATWSPVLFQEMSEVRGQHRFALYNLLERPRLHQPPGLCI